MRKSSPKKKIVAVDWDGTLVDKAGDFLPGALDALRQLTYWAEIIVHSCRGNYTAGAEHINERLAAHDIPHTVWTGQGKPLADYYIDDKAVRFTTWEATYRELRHPDFFR